MKVLYIVTGNKGRVSHIFKNQYSSLKPYLQSSEVFMVKGKGMLGYLKNLQPLRKHIQTYKPDIIHSHYSFCGYLGAFTGSKPLIVSLMGSDVKGNLFFNYLLKFFCKYIWSTVIVKSNDMRKSLYLDDIIVIPNGVDLKLYKPMLMNECQNYLGWDKNKMHILFAANPDRPEKNFNLFINSINRIKEEFKGFEIHFLKNVTRKNVPIYMNASNLVCLSSKWEGSPNVIKEAMSCNRPVVSTDVGDVKWLFGNEEGHFISLEQCVEEYSKKLFQAITYSNSNQKTKGRERLKDLELNSEYIAHRILEVYKSI